MSAATLSPPGRDRDVAVRRERRAARSAGRRRTAGIAVYAVLGVLVVIYL